MTVDKKVIVVRHKELDLETNSPTRKLFNFFTTPILNALPVKSRNFIKKSNKAVSDIVDNATNHNALEILYSKGKKSGVKKIYEKIAHVVWFNTNNSKAVRNRLKIVKYEIEKALRSVQGIHNPINIVSIAAGSARAVLESLEEVNITDTKVCVTFVDKNPEALEYSKKLLSEFNIEKNPNYSFDWVNDTVNGFLDKNTKKYSIVEMVGLMDYFKDDKALAIFQKINKSLEKDGVFITANINDNKERPFVTKAIGWPMIYRKAEDIAHLVQEAGFPHIDVDAYYEPLKIHSIIVARHRS